MARNEGDLPGWLLYGAVSILAVGLVSLGGYIWHRNESDVRTVGAEVEAVRKETQESQVAIWQRIAKESERNNEQDKEIARQAGEQSAVKQTADTTAANVEYIRRRLEERWGTAR